MPKERESELRTLGGNALHQKHSIYVKKAPANRQKELSEFDILSDLKNLSNKSDQLAEKALREDAGLDEWFAALRKTMEDIRDCKNVNDIEYPPSIKTFIEMKDKDEQVSSPAAIASPVLQTTMAASKEVTPSKKAVVASSSKMVTPDKKEMSQNTNCVIPDAQMVTPATSVRKKVNPFALLHQLTNPKIIVGNDKNSHKSNRTILETALMKTPSLNVTFEVMNATKILDTTSAVNSTNEKSIAVSSTCKDSDVKAKSSSKRDDLCSAKKENLHPNTHNMLTRSGSKRKSSDSKNKSSKKQKIDSISVSSTTLNKTAQSRHLLRDLKNSVLLSESKSKLSAVVKPPVLQKQSLVSKEQQIFEELKRKEKKREENIQRVMIERQQKADQNKKAREEKRSKTLQKRLQMEKEKEEKREIEAKKSQAKIIKENPKKTTRAKELVEQYVKESKPSTAISSMQSSSDDDAVAAPITPAPKKSEDCESYDLTPVPDSSTYNFSDDDEDKPANNKRIPTWAQGVHLKSALIQQYYHPVNVDELFGSIIESPNLAEIFQINKKHYFKRTSSAVWHTPPDRSFRH